MGEGLEYDEILEIYNKYPEYKILIKNFIETGTYKAVTTRKMSNFFDTIYTMEIVETLFNESIEVTNKEGITNINFYLGDSLNILPSIMNSLNGNSVFFIDAHQSGSDTNFNQKQRVPLLEELDIILGYNLNETIFIIDDVRFWKGQSINAWDWNHISPEIILEIFNKKNYNIKEWYIKYDRMFIII